MNFKIHKSAYAALMLAVLVLVAFNAPVFAQTNAAKTAAETIAGKIYPFVKLGQWLAVIACFAMAVWEGFKAARGAQGEWSKVIILAIMCIVFVAPSEIAKMLGLSSVSGCIDMFLTKPGANGANSSACTLLQ